KNIKNMIGKFSTILGDNEINITDMINKSKGEVAYTMFDVETPLSQEIIEALKSVEGVFRVRVVK
ncbi:MAG: 3-phosphoglycerate dehydrogenase, partial [Lachnospiraceae bacterium]